MPYSLASAQARLANPAGLMEQSTTRGAAPQQRKPPANRKSDEPPLVVLWNLENLHVPRATGATLAVSRIKDHLAAFGQVKDIKIYCEVCQANLPGQQKQELERNGCTVVNTPHEGRTQVATTFMKMGANEFLLEHREHGGTLCLITNDQSFSETLMQFGLLPQFRTILITDTKLIGGGTAGFRKNAGCVLDFDSVVLHDAPQNSQNSVSPSRSEQQSETSETVMGNHIPAEDEAELQPVPTIHRPRQQPVKQTWFDWLNRVDPDDTVAPPPRTVRRNTVTDDDAQQAVVGAMQRKRNRLDEEPSGETTTTSTSDESSDNRRAVNPFHTGEAVGRRRYEISSEVQLRSRPPMQTASRTISTTARRPTTFLL